MTPIAADALTEDHLGPSTLPENVRVTVVGFPTEQEARAVGEAISDRIIRFSRQLDLSHLDGVTVAHDYAQALASLDRGYETSQALTPSDWHAIGVAMTPPVMRDGKLRSHIVFNAHVVAPIAKPDPESISLALHLIAHECGHVEITKKFDDAFPNILLRQQPPDARHDFRWQVILACWDEYATTRLSANLGEDPTDGYEETFLKHLAEARNKAHAYIFAYRQHSNVDRVYAEVYGEQGDLLKFAAYTLGNADGRRLEVAERATLAAALRGHWFEPYFKRLHEGCRAIAEQYGRWPDKTPFEVIGDIADEVVALCCIRYRYLPDGRLYLDVP